MNAVTCESSYTLFEMPEKFDGRFIGTWILQAVEAQNFWSEMLRDPTFADSTSALCLWCEPSLDFAALEAFAALMQGDPPFHPSTATGAALGPSPAPSGIGSRGRVPYIYGQPTA